MRQEIVWLFLFVVVVFGDGSLYKHKKPSAHPRSSRPSSSLHQGSLASRYYAYKRDDGVGYPSENEIQALLDLFDATNGPNWINSNGWPSGNPCDGWYGVVCTNNTDGNHTVSQLLVTGNNLQGNFPSSIGNLSNLEVLDVSYNSLVGEIGRNIFNNLTILRELWVNNNYFTGSLEFFEDLPTSMEVIYPSENMFEGSIPESIGRFTSVNNFQLFSNSLSGTIPEEIGLMTALQSTDFGLNNFEGTIPSSIGELTNLQNLWMYDCKFSGTLPESIGNLTNLILFEISRNQIRGTIPESFGNLASLQILRLGGNNLTGIPNPMCRMGNITDAILYGNQFSGIPQCAHNLYLRLLLMQDNQLQGQIPDELGYLSNIKRLDLSHNELTGTIPSTFENLNELILLDLSYNLFATTIDTLLVPLARLDRITSVDFSHNNLYGTIPMNIVWNDALQEELSKSITYLYLSHNYLSGEVPDYLSWMFELIYADLSHNNFTGAIPDSLSFLSNLLLEGNELMYGIDGTLPSFLEVDYSTMKKTSGNYSCPNVKGAHGDYTVSLDPAYYNCSYCKCEATFYGLNGTCTSCPPHTTCPGGGLTIIVNPGYYPYPDFINPAYLAECPRDNFGFTPCNPNSEYPFQCKAGYTDRLCSRCIPGYFARGIECNECLGRGPRTAVAVFVALFIVAAYLFFVITKPVASLPSAARKTAIFYFQALNLLLTRFTGWPVVFGFMSTVSSTFNFGFNFTCFFFDFYDIFYVMISLPLISLGVNIAMVGVMYFIKNTAAFEVNLRRWIFSGIRILILTLDFLYLPLCTTIMSIFVCTEDGYSHKKYLAVAPWLTCDSQEYRSATATAALFFVIYVVGIPVVFTYLIWRFRKQLREPDVFASIGTLYVDYAERTYYYELIGLSRRFCIAFVVAVIKSNNLYLMSIILFGVLVFYITIHIRIRPFNFYVSNFLETLGTAVLVFDLISVLSTSSNEEVLSEVIVLLVNLIYILLLLLAVFFGAIHYASTLLSQHHPDLGVEMQKIPSIAYLSNLFSSQSLDSIHKRRSGEVTPTRETIRREFTVWDPKSSTSSTTNMITNNNNNNNNNSTASGNSETNSVDERTLGGSYGETRVFSFGRATVITPLETPSEFSSQDTIQ